MFRMSHQDWERVAALLRELYAETNSTRLPAAIIEGLGRLIPCEHAGYNEINSSTNDATGIIHPYVAKAFELTPVLEAHLSEHPQLTHSRRSNDRGVYQTSDFVSTREFRQMAIYQEFYRHLDTRHQLTCLLSEWGAECDVGISINRKNRGFSERDRSIMEILRPHLIQARQNALAFAQAEQRAQALTETLGAMGSDVVELRGEGRVVWITPRAVEVLARYFPGVTNQSARLPELLERWVQRRRTHLKASSVVAAPLRPYFAQGKQSRLTVRFQAGTCGSSWLLLSEEAEILGEGVSRAFGLTGREGEVLYWITEGKSNPEIAIILCISDRTIHKHVEHIFLKLAVETRHAAALKVVHWRVGEP
jgi:DNA-binding CsgD family transcriptional regulator